jgi:hypothetical protein
MFYEIVHHFPADMIFKEDGPLISLYQPTHRSFPDNKQDPIVFKNLLRVIENSLEQLPTFDMIDTIMKPFYELKEDKNFWNHTSDGIAVFASVDKCIVYNLYHPVKELGVVANSFHTKPLIKAFQSTENYHLLGLNRENFTLYQGNRYGFEEIAIDPDAPRTMKEVLGEQLSDPYLSHASYGGTGGNAMYHGHGDVKDEINKDTEKYFRYVDSFVLENYSKASKLPLILVSLTEHISEFKKISNNPYLLEEGINKSIESMNLVEIQKKAREIIEAISMKETEKMVEAYANAEAESLGSSDLVQVVKAAYESRVKTILMEEDKIVPGKIDNNTGKIKLGDIDDPNYDDILDDLAEMVLLSGGNVFVLTKDLMPSTTGIAAIFRYI